MHINPRDHMLPLGWLPLTAADTKDGFLPVYRRLEKGGHEIFDEWGYLNPDLNWRQIRWQGDTITEGSYALNLIKSAGELAIENQPSEAVMGSQNRCLEHVSEMIKRIPDRLELLLGEHESREVKLTSPNLPVKGSRSDWLAVLPRLIPESELPQLELLARDPARLLHLGYQMLTQEWAKHGQGRAQTAEAVAIIGLGGLGLFPRVRCELCYRLAIPARTRCAHHTQTLVVRLDESGPRVHTQISSEARLGRRVIEKLGWNSMDFVNSHGHDGYVEEKTIAGLLWSLPIGDTGWFLPDLRTAFSKGHFPRVRALLPTNFCELSDKCALALLRLKVDPSEWVISNWYTRVAAAQDWLDAASLLQVRPQMKPAAHNLQRVSIAQEWLQQGVPKKEIAQRLGISLSHLSHLLRRL